MTMKKTITAILACGMLLTFTGCGLTKKEQEQIPDLTAYPIDETEAEPDLTAPSETDANGSEQTAGNDADERLIEDQTFQVTLNPLGEVTFASYNPDTSENPLADVVFQIEKDNRVLFRLPGTTPDNIGLEEFSSVDAVSFPDYNNDGYDDIIIILSYYAGGEPQAPSSHLSVRYYKGSAEGSFLYEKQMSEDACRSLTEIKIETAKDFVSQYGAASEENLSDWKQAYIHYLTHTSVPEAQWGYTLILLDDNDIPELVEIGNDAATGTRIVFYAGGQVHVAQLSRIYFSYIPKGNLLCNSEGNMDYYYDLVLSIKGDEMELVASGYYGAEDNSNVQFDESGEPIYLYEWEGVQMSQEEYAAALNRVYDASKSVSCDYNSLCSAEELIERIKQY